MKAFTRNYQDNSSDAGFQFTFLCDVCNDGYKSAFIESKTYKKNKGSKLFGQGVGLVGNFFSGKAGTAFNTAERGGDIISGRFEGQSPEWRREYEAAFIQAQEAAKPHFKRCPSCFKYVCASCWNADEGLCISCAPRQNVLVATAKSEAMKRNIGEAAASATVWKGTIESKITICPSCGQPSGVGKFCNTCGASLDLAACPRCGAKNAPSVRYCNNCGDNLQITTPGKCKDCGFENPVGTKFCGDCGKKL